MRNHKHYGTPEDNSFIGDIVRYIDGHGGFKDWEKDLLFNRLTEAVTADEVDHARANHNVPTVQVPAEVPELCAWNARPKDEETPLKTQDAPSNPAPCPLSIIQEADDTFSVVIGDRKWPIANCGTIGHTIADGDEFQSAMKKVGEVNYRGFPGEFMLPTNAEMAYLNGIKEMAISRLTRLVAQCDKTSILACNIGKRLGRIVDEDDIQAIAARERLKLLNPESIPTAMTQMQKQERANFINSVAGFPRAPETK